ncbi:MAG TPA: tRNA pseudouridine(55) synthase TruB [Candidatus Baltobacteraceae bacterium]|nr:tRNA pseudouridine(55) synthase TruB [Candidatus Baltobacteraceae bacterium]
MSRVFVNMSDALQAASGFLLVDKPVGPTSHDIVDAARRALRTRKIGHAGTLDPFASGLLILAVGAKTKEISKFVGLDKAYEATLRLGASSDTMDRTGVVTEHKDCAPISEPAFEAALEKFRGAIDQVPPMFSAKKVGGKKLYELARAGETVERKPVAVTIHELALVEYAWPIAKIRTRVSSGTYIRALADDIGTALGCGAYLEELRRTSIGPYKVEDAVKPGGIALTSLRASL